MSYQCLCVAHHSAQDEGSKNLNGKLLLPILSSLPKDLIQTKTMRNPLVGIGFRSWVDFTYTYRFRLLSLVLLLLSLFPAPIYSFFCRSIYFFCVVLFCPVALLLAPFLVLPCSYPLTPLSFPAVPLSLSAFGHPACIDISFTHARVPFPIRLLSPLILESFTPRSFARLRKAYRRGIT